MWEDARVCGSQWAVESAVLGARALAISNLHRALVEGLQAHKLEHSWWNYALLC